MGGSERSLRCAPLTVPILKGLLMGIPNSIEPLAFLYRFYPQVPHGVLVRVKATGRYCEWTGGALRGVDQREAVSALNRMQKRQDEGYDWRIGPGAEEHHEGVGSGGAGDQGTPEVT